MPSEIREQPRTAAAMHPEMTAFLERLGAGITRFDPAAVDLPSFRESAARARAVFDVAPPPLVIKSFELGSAWGPVPARLFRSKDCRPGPALIYLHGGGWTIGSVDTHRRLIAAYALETGSPVIALDYALAPEDPFPTALYQCVTCLQRIRQMSPAFGIDPSRIALGGDSAGANLAVATALACIEMGVMPPAALLSSYGVFDVPYTHRSYVTHDSDDLLLSAAKMAWFWDTYVPASPWRDHPLAAPLRADLRGLPPTYLSIAEIDVLADENLAFAEKASAAGVSAITDLCPGTVHGFVEGVALFDISRQAVARQAAWLRERLA